MSEFIYPLGAVGCFVIGFLFLCLWNFRKLLFLRSPLDSQQHELWRSAEGTTPPDHLNTDKMDF